MYSYQKSEIANIIKTKRKELGISQAELARQLGYSSRSAINKIELGINDIPRAKIEQFSRILALDPSVFLPRGNTSEQIKDKRNELISVIASMTEGELVSLLEFARGLKTKI